MDIIQHASFDRSDVVIENRELVFHGFIQVEKVSLRHRLFEQHHHTPSISRELVRRKQAAGVLLYDDHQQTFALIEQFRIGAIDDPNSPWQLEIIAGVLDGDETPESCIRRESLEESGCDISTLEHLFSFYPSAGACDEIFHLYSAPVSLPTHGGVFGLEEEGENIKLHIFPYDKLNTLLHNQRLRNAPVIIALQWLKQHLFILKR